MPPPYRSTTIRNSVQWVFNDQGNLFVGVFGDLRRRYNMFKVFRGGAACITHSACLKLCTLRREKRRDYNVTIGSSNIFSRCENSNLIPRIFAGRGLSKLNGNGVTVNRIHCSAANNKSGPGGIRPLIVHRVGNGLTLTRGKGLIGTTRLEGTFRLNKTVFRNASSARSVTCTVIRRHLIYGDARRTISEIVGRLGNTCSYIIVATAGLVNFESPVNFHPLYVNGASSNTCIVTSRSYTLSAVNTGFVESVTPNRVMAIDARKVSSSADRYNGYGNKVYIFRCVCFTEPSSIVRKSSIRRTEVHTKRFLTGRDPISTSVMVNIPSSNLSTTLNCSGRDKVPCNINFVGGGCVNEDFVRPDRSRHRSTIHVGLGIIHPGVRNGEIVVVSSSVMENAAYTEVITLLHRTNTGRIRVHISSPPFGCPYCFNASISDRRGLVTYGCGDIRSVTGVVNISSLTCLSVSTARGLTRRSRLGCYSNYFANGCPVRIPGRRPGSGFRAGLGEFSTCCRILS